MSSDRPPERLRTTRWNDVPFAPRQWRFFYGWVIVATSTLGIIASIPGQTMGVGVFTDDLITALGLSRVQLSTAYMFGTIGSSLLLPVAGRFQDRLGLRVMMVLSSLGLGLSVLVLSQSDGLSALVGGSVTASLCAILVCFFLMRFFGQGCLTLASRVAIGKWFNHRRGLATGISGVFVSLGFNGSPLLLNHLVQLLGWRGAALTLAAAVGGGMSLIGLVFHRDNPEACGLVMDGVRDEQWQRQMAARVPETRREFTRSEAIRTLPFWAFNLGLASQALIVTALAFHIASLGEEAGLDRKQAYSVFLPMAAFGVVSNLFAGWLSDRVRLKWLLAAMLLMQAVGTFGLSEFGHFRGRALLVIGYGIGGGLFATIATVTWPRFFGREHLGAISGVNMSVMVFASAIGPVWFSAGQTLSGGYHAIILASLLMPAALVFLSLRAENPQEHVPRSRP
ncbi:MAG: MFS transporter [Phycisphaerae bacterium]|nr:MFS transporter [Phycisphaerae bacterium]